MEKRKPGRPVTVGKTIKKCIVCGDEFGVYRTYIKRQVCSWKCRYSLPQPERNKKTLLDRIRENVTIDSHGCWLWNLKVDKSSGYGCIKAENRDRPVHAVAYESKYGKVPQDLELDHLCRVRRCANPDHVEAVTHRVNVLRSPISPIAINAAKTHCINGHEFTPENTYLRPQRSFTIGAKHDRQCRTCRKAVSKGRVALSL